MNSIRTTLVATAAALLALHVSSIRAQNDTADISGPVIDLFFIEEQTFAIPSLGDQQLAGSIVEANADSTVLVFECVGTAVETELCGTEPATVTFAPSTWVMEDSYGNVHISADCDVSTDTELAQCTVAMTAPAIFFEDPFMDTSEAAEFITASGEELSSVTVSGRVTAADITYLPVTITAGASLLPSPGSENGVGRTSVGIAAVVAGLLGATLQLL